MLLHIYIQIISTLILLINASPLDEHHRLNRRATTTGCVCAITCAGPATVTMTLTVTSTTTVSGGGTIASTTTTTTTTPSASTTTTKAPTTTTTTSTTTTSTSTTTKPPTTTTTSTTTTSTTTTTTKSPATTTTTTTSTTTTSTSTTTTKSPVTTTTTTTSSKLATTTTTVSTTTTSSKSQTTTTTTSAAPNPLLPTASTGNCPAVPTNGPTCIYPNVVQNPMFGQGTNGLASWTVDTTGSAAVAVVSGNACPEPGIQLVESTDNGLGTQFYDTSHCLQVTFQPSGGVARIRQVTTPCVGQTYQGGTYGAQFATAGAAQQSIYLDWLCLNSNFTKDTLTAEGFAPNAIFSGFNPAQYALANTNPYILDIIIQSWGGVGTQTIFFYVPVFNALPGNIGQ